MKASPRSPYPRGYISYLVVLSVGLLLFLLMMAAYRSASASRDTQASSQLRVDVAEKEEAVLRALVDITPNRAIRAMQTRSNTAGAERDSLRWQNIFADALAQANALRSVDAAVLANVSPGTRFNGNASDTTSNNVADVFDAIEPEAGYISVGNNRSLGNGFPVYLTLNDPAQANLDKTYPIITTLKTYGTNASGVVKADVNQYKLYNIIPYPRINFGYGAPGQDFVAKRNWWAFSMNLGRNDKLLGSFNANGGNATERDFVLSIYEIPSQLAISAEAYANIGTHGDGTPWKHATITGGVYATRAQVGAGTELARVSGRNGLTLDGYSKIGGTQMSGNLFVPGAKEQFELTKAEYPVYLSSESGHSAFIPINPGVRFFDRFANEAEVDTLSATTWNTYSSGAMQCAMRIDVTATVSATNTTPTALRFGYLKNGVRATLDMPQVYAAPAALPAGFTYSAPENGSTTFSQAVDVAYGANGKFTFLNGVSGTVNFNNATFGDPVSGTVKAGYWRPRAPFEVKMLRSAKTCIAVYPKRFPAFLGALAADSTETNSSVVVNVDYSTTGLNNPARKPSIPCLESDYGLILQECDNLTGFTKGFSLVSNLRLYIGDDFNTTAAAAAPVGVATPYYPPASIYVPERRYGAEVDPLSLKLSGQMGHLGGDNGGAPARLLDLKLANNAEMGKDNINVNLRPITHPAELPPITMMNWLIVIEERRKEFYQN